MAHSSRTLAGGVTVNFAQLAHQEDSFAATQPGHSGTGEINSVGDWLQYVLSISGVLAGRLLSDCRCQYLTPVRAFIAYHGVALGFTLTEIAHWLHRHPASLIGAIERCTLWHPDLFTANVTEMIRQSRTEDLQRLFRRGTATRRQ